MVVLTKCTDCGQQLAKDDKFLRRHLLVRHGISENKWNHNKKALMEKYFPSSTLSDLPLHHYIPKTQPEMPNKRQAGQAVERPNKTKRQPPKYWADRIKYNWKYSPCSGNFRCGCCGGNNTRGFSYNLTGAIFCGPCNTKIRNLMEHEVTIISIPMGGQPGRRRR